VALCLATSAGLCTVSAGAADLQIHGQSHQVIDGGSYQRLVVEDSDSITVRNAHFAIASADSVVAIRNSNDVRIETSDLDGGGEACEGVSITNSQAVTIAGNAIHDIADDGVEVFDATGLSIRGNTIYRLIGKGTDGTIPGPCYNGHSDGLELTRVTDSTFDGNLIFDVRSDAAVFLSNDAAGPAEYGSALIFVNNVFVTPEASFTMYAFQTQGLQIRNNVIYKGLYGGLAVGDGVTDMDVANNVLESINYAQLGDRYVAAEHRFLHNRVGDAASWNHTPALFGDARGNSLGQPDFAAAPNLPAFGDPAAWRQPVGAPLVFAIADFMPGQESPLIDQGDDAYAPPFDALGDRRPQGDAADIGAVERAPEPISALLGCSAIAALATIAPRRA
jgi:hypothetical protein